MKQNRRCAGLNQGRYRADSLRLSRMEARIRELSADCADMTDAAQYLNANIGLMRVYAERARGNLKGFFADGRLRRWARQLLANGEARVDAETILSSLAALDESELLTAEEIWKAPDVLRLSAAGAFVHAGEKALAMQAAWRRAERWAAAENAEPVYEEEQAFFAHALALVGAAGDAEKRRMLMRALALIGRDEEACVQAAQDAESAGRLEMENLMAAVRALDEINWEDAFERVSFLERTLCRDPAGIYARMERASREILRREVRALARASGYPERSVASLALEIADAEDGVCGVLYTDKGRARLADAMGRERVRMRAVTPDPSGRGYTALYLLVFLILMLAAATFVRGALSVLAAIPAAWTLAGMLLNRLFQRFVPVRPLLRLKMDEVPEDAATLVVIPALITGSERGAELAGQLETLGVLDKSEHVDFLLLGDFRDGKEPQTEKDAEILDRVRTEIARMNARAGREKYFFLHRMREYNEADGIWMGRERKRGALCDLNALLTTGENRFAAEGTRAAALTGRYRYVFTVDADTQTIPGTVEKLIGTIHHPLNRPRADGRGYAVIQPRMELAADGLRNRFQHLFAGAGGADTYHVCAPDVFRDLCGEGLFGGKGIYDVRAFLERTEGAFDDNTVLSHDMIEGLLARCGFAGDLALFEGFPATPDAYLKRMERWTRGDWQLLRYAFGRVRLSALGRFHIFDNLLRSLFHASVGALFVLSVWTGNAAALVSALVCLFLPVALSRFRGLSQAAGRFLLLPAMAATGQAAALRALYRMLISHKRMLEWVTAADADRMNGSGNVAGVAQAILLLPALARPAWLLIALPLAAAFALGKPLLDRLSADDEETVFTSRAFTMMMETARDTWKYFERFVPLSGNGLPPDNVQLDPCAGAAERTSPTNIGMYLMSCVAARELGLIDPGEMRARLRETLRTLHSLPKWHGLLYNWYDTRTLYPLRPAYVSSVDCGNLLAALLVARSASPEEDAGRFQSLIDEMELERLYDEERGLFRIGYDAEKDAPGQSHYDLLASEARILSYVAMAERGIPVRHWEKLGRPCARVRGGCALYSWSGTMFEYMMPFLFMPSATKTLLGVSARGAVGAQIRDGERRRRPWGVSESAYRAFDAAMNYQYRAFGIAELALSGTDEGGVIAPYACMLALPAAPERAAQNLQEMTAQGLRGEFGYYEALDERRENEGGVVFSYMSHHQGMALCALCNALTGGRLNQYFMRAPRERALSVLLNEKPFARPPLFRRPVSNAPASEESARARRLLRGAARTAFAGSGQGHLLFGQDACAWLDADGNGFYRRLGIYANRWHGDAARYPERLLPRVKDDDGEIAFSKCVFESGLASFFGRGSRGSYEICACISPETGAMHIRVRVRALRDAEITCAQRFPVSLADENAMYAHPAFQALFVKAATAGEGAVRYTRIRRSAEDTDFTLYAACAGGEAFEEPAEAGREAEIAVSSRCRARVSAGETKDFYFTLALVRGGAEVSGGADAFLRAQSLAGASARSLLNFCGLNGAVTASLDAICARALTTRPETRVLPHLTGRELWPLGISGDRPILLLSARAAARREALSRLIRAHEYLERAGVPLTMAVLCARKNEYRQPASEEIDRLISASHLNARRNREGGVYVLDAGRLDDAQRALLTALAVNRSEPARPAEAFASLPALPMERTLPPAARLADNGYGGFADDGYQIDVLPNRDTPRPWANILSNADFGLLVTEKGGGFAWHGNSRMGRLTPFDNDVAREGWGVRLYAVTEKGYAPLLPQERPRGAYRVTHAPGETRFECAFDGLSARARWHVDAAESVACMTVEIENDAEETRAVTLVAACDFLMGDNVRDRRLLSVAGENGLIVAQGRMEGVGFLSGAVCEREKLPEHYELADACVSAAVSVAPGERAGRSFLLGWAPTKMDAERLVAKFSPCDSLECTRACWQNRLSRVKVRTGDELRDRLLNGFVKYQALACRVFARTGLYQPGGAYGMRDQLQDMLCVLYMEPALVRAHLLRCAAHQFEDGDGMHWWHEPYSGVRTRISDDMLFLPFVTAEYVRATGDADVLRETVPYLRNVEIPEGREDRYGEAEPSDVRESLHGHCMRAFRRANATGEHGLALMGAGDWNDGMNRVGARGRGESVWLSEFLSYTARLYAPLCREEEEKRALEAMADRLKRAVEESGWDGEWYLRAIDDDGNLLGSASARCCRIDLIAQAWAALNGQDAARVRQALDSADQYLVDRDAYLVRLLDPPFTGDCPDPGYIAAYPAGVRENGGQYTHAATWLAAAFAKAGDANRAWEILDMLLPLRRTADAAGVRRYGAEPYVIPADIRASGAEKGRAGWTWYTGAAAWTERVLLRDLLGLEIENGRARIRPLLAEGMKEVSVELTVGSSRYILASDEAASDAKTWIDLVDDGQVHMARFPMRG